MLGGKRGVSWDLCKRRIPPVLMQIFANGKQLLFFLGILYDTPKKSKGKNLIIVPL